MNVLTETSKRTAHRPPSGVPRVGIVALSSSQGGPRTYARQLRLSSGRYAMIEGIGPDGGRSFQLVPWSRKIEPRLGQHITGIARGGGGVDWSLGRKRGLGI